MRDRVRILLTGIGGYGNLYVQSCLESSRDDIALVGAVDPHPQGCRRLSELTAAGVPLFATQAEFFAAHEADLTVVSSPIFPKRNAAYARLCGSDDWSCSSC